MWESLVKLAEGKICEYLRIAGCGGRSSKEPEAVPLLIDKGMSSPKKRYGSKRGAARGGGGHSPKRNSSSDEDENEERQPHKKIQKSYTRVKLTGPDHLSNPGPSKSPQEQQRNFLRGNYITHSPRPRPVEEEHNPQAHYHADRPIPPGLLQAGNFSRGNNRTQSPRPPTDLTMGNQGIRQHVETSTKTGVFHLSKAKLHEFPPELAKIVTALRSIDLSDNKIQTIPQNISAFQNLKSLNLSTNHIESIPEQIGQLPKLETLQLSHNRITSVPSTLCHLQKLRDVNLSHNQLTSFPVVLCSLKFLTALDLSHNRISSVPDGVQDLQVVELILNQNQVNSVSPSLARCTNLRTLRLQENNLEIGGIPVELLRDSQISLISVEGNLFDVKMLSDLDGYEKYMERYTQTKKKLT